MDSNIEKDTKTNITTVRLNDSENRDLEELAKFFGTTKSEMLIDGMRMVRDLKQVLQELIRDEPELAKLNKDNIIQGVIKLNFKHERAAELAEKILFGLVMKDLKGASRRLQLFLKLFPE